MKNRAEEIVHMMLTHKGYGYRHIPAETLSAFVHYEWDSNRWVMIAEPGSDRILGWLSWYNFDDESLQYVKQFSLIGCFDQQIPLHQGNNLYLANTVVSESASPRIFRQLIRQVKEANPDATSINAFLWNRECPIWRWSSFSMNYRRLNHGRR